MNPKDAILSTYAMGERLVDTYLNDLTDAELLVRPVTGQNHIAWQLGHLVSTEKAILDLIAPGESPALPEGFVENHARDEVSPGSDDPSRFATKAEYLRLRQAQRAATKAVLDRLTEAELDAPGPERIRRLAPTVGLTLLFLGNHDLMHVGQFVGVRRKLGKPIAI